MKLRPVNALPSIRSHLLLMGRILVATNADWEKKFATAMARDVPIIPLNTPEEW